MVLGQSANRGGVYILKAPEAEDQTLYASHSVWENRAVFEVRKTVGRSRAARKGDTLTPWPTATSRVASWRGIEEPG
jgi:hypothetical protein